MIESSVTGFSNMLGSVAGFGPVFLIVILAIFFWEAVIVLSAVLATVTFNRKARRTRTD